MSDSAAASPVKAYDAIVIGAGFAGMNMLYRLRELGLTARVYERGDDVGGTWYWNRYPGARCDTESMTYSFSFSKELEQDWNWTERYAPQAEILDYARHVADRFDMRRDIQFETDVVSAHYDEAAKRWEVRTSAGERATAHFLISAVGCLASAPAVPQYPGIEAFKGEWYHTGHWPHQPVDLAGKRIGIIGTGSSGVQSTIAIAPIASHLFVFQRTPNYSVPSWNGPLAPAQRDEIKAKYDAWREAARYGQIGIPFVSNGKSAKQQTPEEREREYEAAWAEGGFNFIMAYPDLLMDRESNRTAAEFVERKIREKVKDPVIADRLTPKDHPIGAKRLCVDTGYYETFNRDNVTLVDIRSAPIETITATGIQTRDGHYDLDVIIFATGFDAITGPLMRLDIRGRGGQTLRDKWAEGPRNYLGVSTVGFPNFFTITGPGSPSVLSNMLTSIEQHVDWIAGCLRYMAQKGADSIEPTPEAEDDWVRLVHDLGHSTLYPSVDSWYTGTNIPGKLRMFTPYAGGVGTYRQVCDEVVANGYRGFALSAAE